MFRSHYPQGILHHHANLGPYNTAPLITPYMASPLQQGMPSRGLQQVHRPPTIYCSVPPNLFPIPKPKKSFFFFWQGDGRCMTTISLHASLFSRQWMLHVVKLMWGLSDQSLQKILFSMFSQREHRF